MSEGAAGDAATALAQLVALVFSLAACIEARRLAQDRADDRREREWSTTAGRPLTMAV